MNLKVLRHWALLIAIASFVGRSLVTSESIKERRPRFFHEYPPAKEYSDAHDRYMVRKSIYPIKGPVYLKRKHPHLLCLLWDMALSIIWNHLKRSVDKELKETSDGISYIWTHVLRFLRLANPFTNFFNMAVCLLLTFTIKKLLLSRFLLVLVLVLIFTNCM